MKKVILFLVITINITFIISAESYDKELTLPGSTPASTESNTTIASTEPSANPSSHNHETSQLQPNASVTTSYHQSKPKRPEYASEEKRFASFAGWSCDYVTPSDLTKSGLFRTGNDDCTRCFYCGGGLRNWQPSDDVWVEHARWFPKCEFLRQQIGQAFIDTVQEIVKEDGILTFENVIDRMTKDGKPLPCRPGTDP